ncbi:inositol polyphosphate-5-phosphatase A isoform X5 [Trichechus manatus latirostris]|uniref:inositol-polyphosphate 5-phosphatase n=1 Tax=Trichechus manatus latirostris TaxID=127582 RepID=A0A2Y9QQV0_TRIMA|nr:inositol polyphosphate-5-phosphatase A isoform X5 [Trichechus manatus latirostris]
MAGRAAAPGTAVLLVTANVGSLFDDPENLQKNWLREFYQIVHAHKPHFLALHCQEFGGKNYEASMSHVDKFVKELLSSDVMKEYNRARVYLDENYKSQEHFTALGSFYFLHESLKNIHQFDFKGQPEHVLHNPRTLSCSLSEKDPKTALGGRAKKYKKVTGKEIYSDTLESTPMLEKEKFPQEYFPETLCTKATMQTIRAADTNEVVKLIFRESDNDRKVMLQLEKKLFDYFNQEVFQDNNGTALLEFDKELSVFKDRLYELDISFPPSYPYSEDSSQGRQYMNTRCPAWCDRILMSLSAKELILRSESEEKVVTYDHIGPNVCMGDHKPVFLAFRIAPGAGKPHAPVHKCCVVQ